MRQTLITGFFIFLLLLVSVGLVSEYFAVEFGRTNFFENRGVFFLIFITLFPRLTLLFSSVATGGLFWWLGFFFFPRLLVAVLATIAYFYTNPILVVFSWMIAISGELAEKKGIRGQKVFVRFGGRRASSTRGHSSYSRSTQSSKGLQEDGVFEAEYRKVDDE